MTHRASLWPGATLLVSTLLVAGCALPRSGPSHSAVLDQTSEYVDSGGVLLVPATVASVASANVSPRPQVSRAISAGATYAADRIQPGDLLTVVIFENVDPPLVGAAGQRAVTLPVMQVDQQGRIYVPYAGSLSVRGRTEAELRDLLISVFRDQTPDPQIMVSREPGDGAAVTVAGAIATQAVVPLTPQVNSLTRLVAAAGGSTAAPEDTVVTLVRGKNEAVYRLDELYLNEAWDPGLQPGDRILLREDKRSIAVLGATTSQGALDFSGNDFSLTEALANAGGLDLAHAHAEGVFVYREEPRSGQSQPVVYHFDFSQVRAAFLASRFLMRDGDILYVSEAPFSNFSRVMEAIRGTASTGSTLEVLGG